MWSICAISLLLGTSLVDGVRLWDVFERDVTERGVTLVDWEGYMANPAITLRLGLPEQTPYPVDVYLHSSSPRIHFDRESPEDRTGIGRRMRLASEAASTTFRMATFPDRDGDDEEHTLMVQVFKGGSELSRTLVPVRVLDEDRPGPPASYPLLLNYDEDRTGFFDVEKHRKVLRQAADDWEFFLDDQGVDPTPAGDEQIRIWNPDGFVSTRLVRNPEDYHGFLIFASGIQHDEMRAGGAPSREGKPQTKGGAPTDLRRSGAVNFETRGNWNTLGWFMDDADDAWWISGSLRNEPNDFYSIAVHELGHALGFEGTYPLFREVKRDGFKDEALIQYLGFAPTVDASDHFPRVIDPVSGYGGFGMEYQGQMKSRRWLITKCHLLMLQAIGYRIRPTSASRGVSSAFELEAVNANVGTEIRVDPKLSGGVPQYRVTVEGGGLPPGLSVDPFTGVVSGRPSAEGQWVSVLQVSDQDPTTPPKRIVVSVKVIAS